MSVLASFFSVQALPADVDEFTVAFGFGDFSWDLVGEVDALKVDECITDLNVFGLDDREINP